MNKQLLRPFGLKLMVMMLIIPAFLGARETIHADTIFQVSCTDVRDSSFVISWTTDWDTDGVVDWGTTTALGTSTADPISNTSTHLVTVTGLAPTTTYYFQVRSGLLTNDNGGAFFTCTTGTSLAPRSPGQVVWGQVLALGGSVPVSDAIVYLQIQDNNGAGSAGNSQWVTARTDINGFWNFDLSNTRETGLNAYYTFTDGADNLRIVVQGGTAGVIGENGAERIEVVPNIYPAQFDTTLDGVPNAITLKSMGIQDAGTGLLISLLLAAASLVLISTIVILANSSKATIQSGTRKL